MDNINPCIPDRVKEKPENHAYIRLGRKGVVYKLTLHRKNRECQRLDFMCNLHSQNREVLNELGVYFRGML